MTRQTFKSAWWLPGGHLQTIYPALFRHTSLVTRRERITTPDDDFLDLDWCDGDSDCLALLLHGLTGNSQSTYIRGLQKRLSAGGISSVALNFRGCSGEPNRLARGYHSGETGDVNFIYGRLRERFPQRKIIVVGFSLGGNVLLKWLGEQRKNVDVHAAAAVSVPFDLAMCASKLDSGLSTIYRDFLLRGLVRYMREKQRHLSAIGHLEEAEKIKALGCLDGIRSFWEFDDRVVAALHGFDSAAHYYRVSSSRQFLKRIAVPTLIIQARNDPFMTPGVLPERHELSDSIDFALSEQGGHVGFVAGATPLLPVYWLERRLFSHIQQVGSDDN